MSTIPRLLVIDDVLGRHHPDGPNEERANVCANFLLRDVTGDETAWPSQTIRRPVAEVVFHRGQTPACATIGDLVENDLESAVEIVGRGWRVDADQHWSLVLLDLSFYTGRVTAESNASTKGMPEGRDLDAVPPGYFGLRLLERLHEEFPDLPIVILSSRSRAEVALRFATHGALGFIESDAEDGAKALAEAIDRHALIPDLEGRIVGRSRPLLRTLRSARQYAANNQNLLIRGESGTGKELVAEYVNRLRRNSASERPFRIVNSGSLTGELYYSELFGHCKGAFTDARSSRVGMIEQANGGDLFLDEIANMPPQVQNGLLRVLEEGIVLPLGGHSSDAKKVQVRFVTATNADLESMIASGVFRDDLYERLHRGGMIFVPPLRERHQDFELLIDHFVRAAEGEIGARRRAVTADAVAKCRQYAWPRNVRQLQNCLYHAVSSFPDLEYLLPKHITLPRSTSAEGSRAATLQVGLTEMMRLLKELDFNAMVDEDLRGQLPQLEKAVAEFLLRYLRAALVRYRQPNGRLFVQPAIQFVYGDQTLSATKAYDIVKRLVKRAKLDPSVLDADPVLRQAFAKSEKGRSRRRSAAVQPANRD